MDLPLRRRFFAEEIEAVARLRSSALVDALAAVPREQFLRPGPWTVLADSAESYMMGAGVRTRTTPDADPARVYHNVAVAIDPARSLFNGQPATVATWIDLLEVARGARVVHIGAGLGYYTAILAHCVGPAGHVVAYEADGVLAHEAQRNLASHPWVEVRHADASGDIGGEVDAVIVNAGVTHPLDAWLDALSPAGRMLLPITATMPAMGANIGKGVVVLLTKEGAHMSARVAAVVAVYSAVGVRDADMNERVGKALMSGPQRWQAVDELRRDAHEPDVTCWLHGRTMCLSAAPGAAGR
jgi:protein-L-isoaspartate(D-aspartate) O-methyltransferase